MAKNDEIHLKHLSLFFILNFCCTDKLNKLKKILIIIYTFYYKKLYMIIKLKNNL